MLSGVLVSCNLLTLYFILIGPLFEVQDDEQDHSVGKCTLRDAEDLNVFTKLATSVVLVGVLAIHFSWWHAIMIFRAAQKKKLARQESSTTVISPPSDAAAS